MLRNRGNSKQLPIRYLTARKLIAIIFTSRKATFQRKNEENGKDKDGFLLHKLRK